MSLSLSEYRAKLVNKILLASSQEEVQRFVDTAMLSLERNGVNKHITVRFVEKIINDLGLFSPIKEDAQQWSNIKMAKLVFNRIKRQFSSLTN